MLRFYGIANRDLVGSANVGDAHLDKETKMTGDFLSVRDLIQKVELPDEDKHFIKSSLWREGATPKITSPSNMRATAGSPPNLKANMVRRYEAPCSLSAHLTACS